MQRNGLPATPLMRGVRYTRMNTATQSWSDIRDRYQGLGNDSKMGKDMLRLVEHVSNSPVAEGLHVWTSMFDLCITQTQQSPYDDVPYLRISHKEHGKIEFRYMDTYKNDKQWFREVDAKYSTDRFDKFIDQIHWMIKVK